MFQIVCLSLHCLSITVSQPMPFSINPILLIGITTLLESVPLPFTLEHDLHAYIL